MMAYSQKYVLAHFISPVKTGESFHMSDWLLHTTLVDVFAIDRHTVDIDTKLTALLGNSDPVTTTAVGDGTLGTTAVVLLDKTSELLELHSKTVSLLKQNGAVFNNPEFTNEGFIPHSTIQKTGRLHIGDSVFIDSISLIDMFPGGDWEQRAVLATFKLG